MVVRDPRPWPLEAGGILVGIHYRAIHLFGLCHLGYGPGDFPVAERIGVQILTLLPAMSGQCDVDRVCEAIEGLLHA